MIRAALMAAVVAVTLPGDYVPFEDRPNAPAEAVNGNCLACHSGEMILSQPHLTPAEWRAEVTKMRNIYKAPIDPADDKAIIAWLTAPHH